MVFPHYSRFSSPPIVKTANTKTAINEGRLYTKTNNLNERTALGLVKKGLSAI